MPAQRHQTHIPLIHINRYLPQRLRSIRVKRNTKLLTYFPNLLHRLNHPNLIINRHNRNQTRIAPNRIPKVI
ncbi:hypothetical protein HanIR_Chr14g0705211 [Helianthus annuus]|nr:hypothetical protein HanIR_Chr14g0705211 [Helianthus annuus]